MARTLVVKGRAAGGTTPAPVVKYSRAVWCRLAAHVSTIAVPQALVPILNQWASDILVALTKQARVVQGPKLATMSARHMQTAVRLLLPGELAKHAMSEGTKAVAKWSCGGSKALSKGHGLTLLPTKVHTALKKLKISNRTGKTTSIYLAATIEYLSAELFELAAKESSSTGKGRKKGKALRLQLWGLASAIRNDEELKALSKRIEFKQPQLQGLPFTDVEDIQGPQLMSNGKAKSRPFAKTAFTNLVKDVASNYKDGLRFRASAIEKLQVAAEAHLVKFLKEKQAEQGKQRQMGGGRVFGGLGAKPAAGFNSGAVSLTPISTGGFKSTGFSVGVPVQKPPASAFGPGGVGPSPQGGFAQAVAAPAAVPMKAMKKAAPAKKATAKKVATKKVATKAAAKAPPAGSFNF